MAHHPYDGGVEQLLEMRQLIIESERDTAAPQSWQYALLENWRFADTDNPLEFFQRNAHLWRDPDGRLVGFVASYHGDVKATLRVHPEHARLLLPEMLAWLEERWRALGKPSLRVGCYRQDALRRELLRARGYVRSLPMNCVYRYDLGLGWPDAGLPAGYRIASVREHGDIDGIIALESVTFETNRLDRAWYTAKSSAPGYSPDLHLHVLAPDGQLVAFAHGWPEVPGRRGEIDPVGTHPAHRRLGLAAAVVTACFGRMRDLGIENVYIAAEAEPCPANRLYESLAPTVKYYEDRWTKEL